VPRARALVHQGLGMTRLIYQPMGRYFVGGITQPRPRLGGGIHGRVMQHNKARARIIFARPKIRRRNPPAYGTTARYGDGSQPQA
jgi:hypothetical protein